MGWQLFQLITGIQVIIIITIVVIIIIIMCSLSCILYCSILYLLILYVQTFILLRDAYRGLCYGKMSVCPSVCPPHAGMSSKWLNIPSNFFHHRVATLF